MDNMLKDDPGLFGSLTIISPSCDNAAVWKCDNIAIIKSDGEKKKMPQVL